PRQLHSVPTRGSSDLLVVRVEAQQEGIVDDGLASFSLFGDGVAIEVDRQALAEPGVPILGAHLPCRGSEPGDVPTLLTSSHRTTGEEATTTEHRVLGAHL